MTTRSARILIQSSDFDTSLTIKNTEETDEGQYSCKINSSEGIEISKCQIEIDKPKSRMDSVKKSLHADSRSLATKFGFLTHIQSQIVTQGEPLILECSVYGSSPLELVWLRNSKEIPQNPDFVREQKDNIHRLVVTEVFPEDSGIFSAELFCAASNQAVMTACSVIVLGKISTEKKDSLNSIILISLLF